MEDMSVLLIHICFSSEMPKAKFTVELDAANVTWLSPDVAMFSSKTGDLLLLTLIYDGRYCCCNFFDKIIINLRQWHLTCCMQIINFIEALRKMVANSSIIVFFLMMLFVNFMIAFSFFCCKVSLVDCHYLSNVK